VVELRRRDVDLEAGQLMVRRAAVVVSGQAIVGTPKGAADVPDVAILPHLLPALRRHLTEHGEWSKMAC
jgi:hypothetical protein